MDEQQLELGWSATQKARASARKHARRRRGRPLPAGQRRNVPHRPRVVHGGRHPVHVTMRAGARLPSLRAERVRNVILRALRAQAARVGSTFRVVHFSIQPDHLHLIVEAAVPPSRGDRAKAASTQVMLPFFETTATNETSPLDEPLRIMEHVIESESHVCVTAHACAMVAPATERGIGAPTVDVTDGAASRRRSNNSNVGVVYSERALRHGIAGLATSLARRLNRLFQRKGKFWGDRHHRRDLDCPTSVRRALVYVLQNHTHHRTTLGAALDALSTAGDFDGWSPGTRRPPALWRPPLGAQTWLLRVGWLHAGGHLRPTERPT